MRNLALHRGYLLKVEKAKSKSKSKKKDPPNGGSLYSDGFSGSNGEPWQPFVLASV